ncbi:MAG: TolC family protein [Candidatus Aminicenantales bacterium]
MKTKKDLILCLSFLFLWLPAGGADQREKLSLNELLSLAKERNPGLLALQAEVKAGQFPVLPQATLPDPVVSFSLRNIGATELTVGKEMMSGVGFSVSEMIPFPGKLRLRGEIALTRVRRAEQTRDAYTLSLFRQLKEL